MDDDLTIGSARVISAMLIHAYLAEFIIDHPEFVENSHILRSMNLAATILNSGNPAEIIATQIYINSISGDNDDQMS